MTIVEGNMLSELNIYVFIVDSFILMAVGHAVGVLRTVWYV